MADRILLDTDIQRESIENDLLTPFAIEKLKRASYDIRVGKTAIIILPEQKGGYVRVDVEYEGNLEVPVGRTAVIYSLERVNLPTDIKARTSLRAYFATRGLMYNGGVIDPDYHGHLFFTVANLGLSPVQLPYGEGFVTTEFVRLGRPAFTIYNEGGGRSSKYRPRNCRLCRSKVKLRSQET